jgi:hypothetical protein
MIVCRVFNSGGLSSTIHFVTLSDTGIFSFGRRRYTIFEIKRR